MFTYFSAIKARLLCGTQRRTADSLAREDSRGKTNFKPTESSSGRAENYRLQRSTTSTTITSSITPVSERNRRYTNESLSSLANSTGGWKVKRRNTDDSASSPIIAFRDHVRRRCTSSSDEMSGSNGRDRRRRISRKSLRSDIKAVMVLQDHADLQFVPASALSELFCKDTVARILDRHKDSFEEKLSSLEAFIYSKATIIFAILAWADSESLIEEFFQHNFADEQLPVRLVINEDLVDAISLRLGNTRIEEHPFNNAHWTDRNIEDFCNSYQWPFLSPVFEESQFRYEFPKRTRMPFVDERHKSFKESYFSVVEEWRIHRDHIRTPKLIRMPKDSKEHPTVAVKRLKQMTMNDADFKAVAGSEVDALEAIRDLDHPHLVKAVAYYSIGKNHYIMFPWARWGNLRAFWEKESPRLDREFLQWVFAQMCGLAGAIKTLHHSHKERSLRHGDLKPENILCFDDPSKEADDKIGSCILVIADVGLSRSHEKVTELRNMATRTKSGTIKYEPPETELQPNEPRSRRYDVWSIGCIYLEFAIWILYGPEGLDHFREDLGALGETTRFYVIEQIQHSDKTRIPTARLNNVVQKWIDWIKKDARCQRPTAIRSLVDLIVERLLIVDVSAPSRIESRRLTFLDNEDSKSGTVPSFSLRAPTVDFTSANDPTHRARASAEEMDEKLKSIFEQATTSTRDQVEWINFNAPSQHGPKRYGDRLVASDAAERRNQQNEYRFTPLDDTWKYAPDTDMARRIFADPTMRSSATQSMKPSQLCFRCRDLPIGLSRHEFSDTLTGLTAGSRSCGLCRLLMKHVHAEVESDHETLNFFIVGSSLIFQDCLLLPILSIYAAPGRHTLDFDESTVSLQFGFPELHEPSSHAHMKILDGWIHNCNENHQCFPKMKTFLPTRVLDVGQGLGIVRLFCGTRGYTSLGRYIALSHQWGSPEQHGNFCTYKDNISRHQHGITIDKLPKTFRDAIVVCRSLGIQYLWIDSLCIIQDDTEDWARESKLMERVYSSAYVTIAATCASGTTDGFLKPRPHRDCVIMENKVGMSHYICDAIDDFTRDVEQGNLNRRGWVLQERALSRRTIYFAENQTYWECGEGVRCETLTRMNNKKASFLGDSDFPNSIESSVKGTKILLFQNLYEKYAAMELSFMKDRPMAIRGLEKRLVRTFKTKGGFGMFECYMHRCLLWKRASWSLSPINTFGEESTPSWSWMAYAGGIRFMDIPFGDMSWADDIYSPWHHDAIADDHAESCEQKVRQPSAIQAPAWELANSFAPENLFLDDRSRSLPQSLRYIVVGTEKSKRPGSNYHRVYVLIVASVSGHGERAYQRVGVGILAEPLICKSKVPAMIRLT